MSTVSNLNDEVSQDYAVSSETPASSFLDDEFPNGTIDNCRDLVGLLQHLRLSEMDSVILPTERSQNAEYKLLEQLDRSLAGLEISKQTSPAHQLTPAAMSAEVDTAGDRKTPVSGFDEDYHALETAIRDARQVADLLSVADKNDCDANGAGYALERMLKRALDIHRQLWKYHPGNV